MPMFCRLSKSPDPILNEDDMNKLERFIALLYKRSTHLVDINELRKVLFAQLENIPPSKAALTEHIKRALFQAGHIWGLKSLMQIQYCHLLLNLDG